VSDCHFRDLPVHPTPLPTPLLIAVKPAGMHMVLALLTQAASIIRPYPLARSKQGATQVSQELRRDVHVHAVEVRQLTDPNESIKDRFLRHIFWVLRLAVDNLDAMTAWQSRNTRARYIGEFLTTAVHHCVGELVVLEFPAQSIERSESAVLIILDNGASSMTASDVGVMLSSDLTAVQPVGVDAELCRVEVRQSKAGCVERVCLLRIAC